MQLKSKRVLENFTTDFTVFDTWQLSKFAIPAVCSSHLRLSISLYLLSLSFSDSVSVCLYFCLSLSLEICVFFIHLEIKPNRFILYICSLFILKKNTIDLYYIYLCILNKQHTEKDRNKTNTERDILRQIFQAHVKRETSRM